MSLPIIANTVRASVRGGTAFGTPWVNVHHYRYVGAVPTHAQLDTLAASIDRLYGNGAVYAGGVGLINSCKTTCQALDVTFTPLDGVTPSYTKAIIAAGGSASASLPSEVAEVVTLRTNTRGRRYRGRIYLPAYSVTNVDAAGNLPATLPALVVAQFAGFWADIAGQAPAWTQVVASYKGVFATLITSVSMDLRADVQRRRKS